MAKAKQEKVLERVVKGPKPLHHIDPLTGLRFLAKVGDKIKVRAQQAISKAHLLIDPRVAEAEKVAAAAAAESLAEAAKGDFVAGAEEGVEAADKAEDDS
jgi:hypothetical protein